MESGVNSPSLVVQARRRISKMQLGLQEEIIVFREVKTDSRDVYARAIESYFPIGHPGFTYSTYSTSKIDTKASFQSVLVLDCDVDQRLVASTF